MLSFSHRFHGHNSLRYVYKNGHVSRTKHVTLKTTINPRRNTPRVAVVVSRKISKRAVYRNRIRRRIYEWFRSELEALPSKVDIVIIVTSPDIITMSAAELRDTLHTVVGRAGLYKIDDKPVTIK